MLPLMKRTTIDTVVRGSIYRVKYRRSKDKLLKFYGMVRRHPVNHRFWLAEPIFYIEDKKKGQNKEILCCSFEQAIETCIRITAENGYNYNAWKNRTRKQNENKHQFFKATVGR